MEVPKLSFSYIDGFSYPINFFILKKFPSLKTYHICFLRKFLIKKVYFYKLFIPKDLHYAMRRAGQNPTESEVQDMINKIDDGTASLNFEERQIINSSEYTYV